MDGKRIKFYAMRSGQIGYVGVDIHAYKKPHVYFEVFDTDPGDDSNPDNAFVININEWNKIVEFIEDELKDLTS